MDKFQLIAQSVILHTQITETVGPYRLLEFVNDSTVAGLRTPFMLLQTDDSQSVYILTNNIDTHICVGEVASPAMSEWFGAALQEQYVQFAIPDASQLVAASQSYTNIAVNQGALPSQVQPAENLENSSQAHDGRLALCHAVTSFFNEWKAASLVYWAYTDTLFSSEKYASFSEKLLPVPLIIHWHIFSNGAGACGRPLIGARTTGVERILSKEILFNEAPVTLDYLIEHITNYIELIQERGSIHKNGESISDNDDEVIRITYRPATSFNPCALVELNLDFSVSMNVTPNAEGKNGERAEPAIADLQPVQRELDPKDPIDAAILRKMNAQRDLV